MAIKIQHYYTTGGDAPQPSDLSFGEIAIAHGNGQEGIFFVNTFGQVVSPTFAYETKDIDTEEDLITLKRVINLADDTFANVDLNVKKWNKSAEDINKFLTSTDTGGTIDNLYEIQEKLKEVSEANELVNRIEGLKSIVGTGFTESITEKLYNYEHVTSSDASVNDTTAYVTSLGVHSLFKGDVDKFPTSLLGKSTYAVSVEHTHGNYVTINELSDGSRDLVFACGTY
jgi:hypothetical protein